MRTWLASLFALVVVLALPACGEDDRRSGSPLDRDGGGPSPYLQLDEVQNLLEDELDLVRTGGGGSIASEVDPAPVDSARLETNDGAEFDLLSFATPEAARSAWHSIRRTDVVHDGGAATRAANVVAVFPHPPREHGAYRIAWRDLRRLAVACTGHGERELRSLCFSTDPPDAGAPGPGTASRALVPPGSTAEVAHVRYTIQKARELNPHIAPDRTLVAGRRPSNDNIFLGVFVRACNRSDIMRRTTAKLTLVGAFGGRVPPVALSADNAFAFHAQPLPPDRCEPRAGSAADHTAAGALVLFDIDPDMLDNRPLALRIADGGEIRWMKLGL
jgi:hypothetical protein